MVQRNYWIEQVEARWQHRSVLWLSGVRRVGKTYLSQSLQNIEFFDCELPRIRRLMDNPEDFLSGVKNQRVILDEIHRLDNPSQLLKIAADYYPDTKILATGSSTLGASTKFKDTLAGRKTELWLTPMISADLDSFQRPELRHRLLRGGLPPFFLAKELPEHDFQEWMDAYWAKDIQELFRLERRHAFQKFAELLLIQSGGIFDATRFATQCEVSRTTISNYLKVLEATFVVHVVRPYGTNRQVEIVSAPKVYGFDTGFVCYHRGWTDLRREDMGHVWEHFVLNELHSHLQTRRIYYWRNKRGKEVDFVLPQRGQSAIAIECKWSAADISPNGLKAFERRYPNSHLFVVANDVDRSYERSYGDVRIKFVGLRELIAEIQ